MAEVAFRHCPEEMRSAVLVIKDVEVPRDDLEIHSFFKSQVSITNTFMGGGN